MEKLPNQTKYERRPGLPGSVVGGAPNMFSFYNVIGRSLRPACLIAFLVTFMASSAEAQVTSNIAFPDFAHARSVVFIDDGGSEVQLVGTHSYGVYRSVPGAIGKNRWTDPSGLTNPLTVNDIAEVNSGARLLLGASGSGGQQTDTEATGLFYSDDKGVTWTPYVKSNFDSLAVHTVQAITQSPVDNVIFLSADDGNIFISTDGGASWIFNGRLPGGSSQTPWTLLAHPTIAGTVYAGTPGYGVYVSADHGGLWVAFTDNSSLLTPGLTPNTSTGGNYVFDLEMNPASPNEMYAGTASGVWKFDDVTSATGAWARVAAADSSFTLDDAVTVVNVYPEVRSLAFDAAGTTLYMATWGFGVLTTTEFAGTITANTGITGIGLRGQEVSVVAVSPSGTVFAGTNGGVFEVGAASSTSTTPEGETPVSYALGQNYPNPFNPSTAISFELPAGADVSLAVFDVLGRQVAQLASGTYPAGSHSVTFDASGLQSGLYIYRLDAGDQSIARTMTLVK
ncbi:MAG: T9SS type A sorting domain-containing protein [Rhodothermales bacterium]|nr:T9SS type A sorting domain-containing protein [Rhodothermales bacterium]